MIWGEWISNLNISLRCLWLWQAVQCAKRDFSSFDDLLADAAWFHVAMRYTGTRLCFRHHIIITSVSRTELNLWLSSYVWTPTSLPPPPAVYYSQTSQQLLPATTNKRYFTSSRVEFTGSLQCLLVQLHNNHFVAAFKEQDNRFTVVLSSTLESLLR